MADNTVVHIGENSAEQIAYKLLVHVANVEGRNIHNTNNTPADREYILRTYAQCIYTVRNPQYWKDALKDL